MTEAEDFMLNELLDLEEGLDDWSVDFIEDLARRRKEIGEHYRLSEKQHNKLTELWERHCDG